MDFITRTMAATIRMRLQMLRITVSVIWFFTIGTDLVSANVSGPRPGLLEEGECGEFRNTVSSDLLIVSPNYPDNYPDRLSCEKIIEAKPGYVARLFFLDFQLEPSHNCWLDRLEIYQLDDKDEWRLDDYYCGTYKPTLVLSENPIKLHLHTDRYTTYKGFKGVLQYIAA